MEDIAWVTGMHIIKHTLQLTSVNATVLDTDECLEAALNNQNLCDDSELCNNIPGSYMCRCPGGTEYNLTSQTCIVIKGIVVCPMSRLNCTNRLKTEFSKNCIIN